MLLLLFLFPPVISDTRTLFGCDGSIVSVTCPYGYNISIVRANYGRFSISVCNHGAIEWDTYCGTEGITTQKLRDMCDRQSICNISVNSSLVTAPCEDMNPYLEVQYNCEEQPRLGEIQMKSVWSSRGDRLDLGEAVQAALRDREHRSFTTVHQIITNPVNLTDITSENKTIIIESESYLKNSTKESVLLSPTISSVQEYVIIIVISTVIVIICIISVAILVIKVKIDYMILYLKPRKKPNNEYLLGENSIINKNIK